MKICGIYKITSPTRKVYIGQSVNIYARIRMYKNLLCKNQPKLYASLLKHGWATHAFKIIVTCAPEQLNEMEIYHINLYNSFNTKHGLNLTSGGDRPSMSAETRQKLSLAAKGRKHTKEWKEKMSEKMKGRVFSDESKLKMSISNKGRKHSKDHIRKTRRKKGFKLSEEHKAKIGAANKKAWINKQTGCSQYGYDGQ